jgi:hypothetical protein
MIPTPNDPLSSELQQWRVEPSSNPQFRTSVWAKIEATRRAASWSSFARAHPALVTVFLASGALFGAWSGRVQAREQFETDRSVLAANYVHELDARWMRSQ